MNYFNNNSLDKIKSSQMSALKTILIKNKAPVREFILTHLAKKL